MYGSARDALRGYLHKYNKAYFGKRVVFQLKRVCAIILRTRFVLIRNRERSLVVKQLPSKQWMGETVRGTVARPFEIFYEDNEVK